jgi:hypothetical protein
VIVVEFSLLVYANFSQTSLLIFIQPLVPCLLNFRKSKDRRWHSKTPKNKRKAYELRFYNRVDVAKFCSGHHRSGIGTCPKVHLASFSTVCVSAATVAPFRAARVVSNTEAGVACYCAARSVRRDGEVGGVLPINKYFGRGCVCEAEEKKGSSGEVDKLHD